MPTDTTAIPAGNTAEANGKPGGKVRLSTLDGRTRIGRRVTELLQLYGDVLGGWAALTPLTQEKVNTAAHRRALGEHARERYLAGENIALDDVVRAERLGDVAVRALNLDKVAKGVPQSVDAYLASREAAQ